MASGLTLLSETRATAPFREVKFGSDEYFELISKYPKIAAHLALGKKVDLIWNGVGYRIRE